MLGVSDVRFLGHPDGCIEPSYTLRRDITRLIRQVQPARLLTWSPEWSRRRFHRNQGFLGDEGQGRVHQAYPAATWERLAAVKARYDPTNLFHHNHNIPPAT